MMIMVDVALWVVAGLAVAYVVVRLGLAWLVPQIHR
jgi:hypothetical protein